MPGRTEHGSVALGLAPKGVRGRVANGEVSFHLGQTTSADPSSPQNLPYKIRSHLIRGTVEESSGNLPPIIWEVADESVIRFGRTA
jgi:hypothetical protein